MTRSEFETWLGNELRNVTVPPDLRDRLRRTLASDDAGIDARLADVEVPSQLIHRLQDEVAGLVIDESLREVTIPVRLSRSLRGFVRRRAIAPLLSTAAAVLFLAVGGFWLASLDVQNVARTESAPKPQSLAAQGETVGSPKSQAVGGQSASSAIPVGAAVVAAGDAREGPRPSAARRRTARAARSRPRNASPNTRAKRRPSFDSERSREALAAAGLVLDTAPPEHALGAPLLRVTCPPPLRRVQPLFTLGGEMPQSPEFNRQFLAKHRVNPLVFPARNSQLTQSRVMLSSSVESYERVRAELEAGRWPAAADVRVEDFLAAARYPLPSAPPRKLALFTNLGPSPFRAGHHVLQIAVKAGEASPRGTKGGTPGTLLTVVVDVAPEMQYRLREVQRALRHTIARMRNRDRLSLVLSTSKPSLVLDYASRDQAAAWIDQLASPLSVDPRGDLVGAVQLANRAIRKPVDITRQHRRQVVISCSGRQLTDPEARELEKAFSELQQDQIGCVFADVGVEGSEEDAGYRSFDQVATRAGLAMLPRSLSEPLYPLVDHWLPHRKHAVAHDVQLTVKFDPKTVLSYRLVGYEPSAEGLTPDSQPGPLRAHEVASAFYELELSDAGKGRIASIVVKWSNAMHNTGAPLKRNLGRGSIAASALDSAPALRLAALIAETAEVLRGSPFASISSNEMQLLVDQAKVLWPSIDAAGNRDLETLLQSATRISAAAPVGRSAFRE